MKTKIFSLTLLAASLAFAGNAQEYKPQVGSSNKIGAKTTFKTNKAGDNWFISIAGAGSMLVGDDNGKASFGDRLNINPQLSVGKFFQPWWGFRLQFMGGPLVGYDAQRDAPALFKQKNKYFGVHLDYLLDVTNLWGRYNEKKVFRLIPWLGLGYAQRFENQGYSRTETPTVNAGILTAFRLSKRVDLNVEVQGALTNEDFNRIYEYHLCDFIAQASVGLTFKLGRTDFEVCEPTDYGLLNNLNDQINKLRAENEELSKRPESCPVCQQVQPAAKPAQNYGKNVVFFRLNSARIDKDQEINVYNTAQFVKEHNVPVTVIGYADKKTGSSKYNMALSEKRAKAVAKQLMDKYGIPSNQISIEYHGSDEQPYHINNWNRVVIMTAEQGQE